MSESPRAKEPTGRASPAVDRISNLPTVITDNILKRLPLRDAVRTSILSKDWRHKWLTLPDLVFGPKFTSFLGGSWNPEFIIDCILLRHEGPISKFHVVEIIGSYDAFECWLHFLLKHHHIEDLRLWYPTHLGLFVPGHPQTAGRPVPSEVFSFDCLKKMSLFNGRVRLPPAFKGLRKLVDLHLAFVRIELEEFNTLLSACPMLEKLEMIECLDTESWFLDIDVPNLKHFHFFGHFSSISFKNAANVEYLFVGCPDIGSPTPDYSELPRSRGSKSNLIKIFSELPSVKYVQLSGWFEVEEFHFAFSIYATMFEISWFKLISHFLLYFLYKFLAIGGVPQKLSYNLNHVTSLRIDYFKLGSLDQVSCTLCLLRSCPNLRSLYFSFQHYREEAPAVVQYLKAQWTCNVTLSHLKRVDINSMFGWDSELEFVKLLLHWATALKSLHIRSSFRHRPTAIHGERDEEVEYDKLFMEYEMLKKVASFHRASGSTLIFV